ncbi:MAG: hypothetical protein IMY67_11255 [Bacteroidetes bacterium]|nr:hypothetical protein [Bacteroidota bacterium]
MKPTKFKEHNTVIKTPKDFYDIPIFAADTVEGHVVMCYGLSFWERLRVLFTGKIWISVLSYQKPLNPMFLGTVKKEVIK